VSSFFLQGFPGNANLLIGIEDLKAADLEIGVPGLKGLDARDNRLDTLGGSPSARDYLSKITSHEDCVYFER
jgi:hypothetical protein